MSLQEKLAYYRAQKLALQNRKTHLQISQKRLEEKIAQLGTIDYSAAEFIGQNYEAYLEKIQNTQATLSGTVGRVAASNQSAIENRLGVIQEQITDLEELLS